MTAPRKVKDPELLLPILPLLADGWTTSQIARHVHMSYDGAKNRVNGLLWLLGVDSRAAAVSQAYRHGLLGAVDGQLTDRARHIMQQPSPHDRRVKTSGVNAAPALLATGAEQGSERTVTTRPTSAAAVSAPD